MNKKKKEILIKMLLIQLELDKKKNNLIKLIYYFDNLFRNFKKFQ